MTNAAGQRLSEYVRRRALGAQTQSRSPDADLLGRVVIDRDEAAFETIVRRHGSAVRAACRRVLGPTPDADDAFQATFVVFWREAARVRKSGSVGAWLYGTAHRIACQARIAAARRRRLEQNAAAGTPIGMELPDPSWREACGILHEELDRLPDHYRLPLVLCYLESKSRDEAAAQLGWSVGSVKGRLERGRDRLRRRLMRRGIDLSAGLLAALAGESRAGVPMALLRATVESAGGVPPAAVAALVRGAGVVTHNKLAAVAVAFCVATAGAGIGLFIPSGTTPGEPTPVALPAIPAPTGETTTTVTFRGRVVDPEGKPVSGARLFTYQRAVAAAPARSQLEPTECGATGSDGQFHFSAPRTLLDRRGNQTDLLPILAAAGGFGVSWVKLPQPDEDLTVRLDPDQPISIRVLDSEGRAVPGVTVRVKELIRYRAARLDRFLAGWQADWRDALFADYDIGLDHPPDSIVRVTRLDRDGRFRISGVGAERRVILDVQGPGLAQGMPFVVTRAGFDPEPVNRAARERAHPLNLPPVLHGPTFDYVAVPAKPIVGTVREAVTGRPVAGAKLICNSSYSYDASATTDAAGHFRLDGIPKEKEYSLSVRPPAGSPLIARSVQLSDTAGLEPLTADAKLIRGVMVTGRVIDRQTGHGTRAGVSFYLLPDNPNVRKSEFNPDGQLQSEFSTNADKGGCFRLPVIPGPGVLTIHASDTDWMDDQQVDPFLPADPDEQDRKRAHLTTQGDRNYFVTAADGHSHPIGGHVIKWLDPTVGIDPEPLELFLDRGRTTMVRIEGPDGQPLTGAIVSGLTAMWPITYALPRAECTLIALDPGRPRTVLFYHPDRKLVAVLRVRGDESGPLTVRLLPSSGTITGRVLDGDGQPIVGVRVSHYYPEDESAQELRRYLSARGALATRTQTDMAGRFRIDEVFPDLKLDLSLRQGTTTLAGPKGNLWFGPHRVAGGKTLDIGDIRTKARGE
jgi:RNA polymerase sigma factor (sigma-70 family)